MPGLSDRAERSSFHLRVYLPKDDRQESDQPVLVLSIDWHLDASSTFEEDLQLAGIGPPARYGPGSGRAACTSCCPA